MTYAAPGLRAQSPLRLRRRVGDLEGFVSLESGEPIEFPYDFEAVMEVIAGRYEVTQLGLGGAGAIGTGWLAKTPIPELRLRALNYTNVEVEMPDGTWEPQYANKWIEDCILVLRGTPPLTQLEVLATAYRVIRLGWRSPVARLAEMLDVHHDTVRRWIVTAVKNGQLEPWERG